MDKNRREEIISDVVKKLKKSNIYTKKDEQKIRLTVNKVKTNNKKFTKLTNDLIEKMGLDRSVALKQADFLLKVPKADIKKLLKAGKLSEKEIEIFKDYLEFRKP